MIKAIIFDCWNTLFHGTLKPHHFVDFADRIGKDMEDYNYLKLFETHFMLEKHYELEVPIKKLLSELSIEYSEKLINELKGILKKGIILVKDYPDTLKALEKLKQNYKLGMISNTGYLAFKKLDELFKLDKYFEVILKSYEIEILKPDPKIFELMLKELKVKKDEVIMIGDSLPDDVKAAEKFGIKGILLDRKNKYPKYKDRITSLTEIHRFL
jgi:2-haloalkanoic acid dehalogenase type II